MRRRPASVLLHDNKSQSALTATLAWQLIFETRSASVLCRLDLIAGEAVLLFLLVTYAVVLHAQRHVAMCKGADLSSALLLEDQHVCAQHTWWLINVQERIHRR
jgi:hypothetical protein